jgi:hypothetical protein
MAHTSVCHGWLYFIFAIFHVDDTYLATRNPVFLQVLLNSLVSLFKCVVLETNVEKMQAMICTPGQISTYLLADSYRHRHASGLTQENSGMQGQSCADNAR